MSDNYLNFTKEQEDRIMNMPLVPVKIISTEEFKKLYPEDREPYPYDRLSDED